MYYESHLYTSKAFHKTLLHLHTFAMLMKQPTFKNKKPTVLIPVSVDVHESLF